jgi:hypothetical protein
MHMSKPAHLVVSVYSNPQEDIDCDFLRLDGFLFPHVTGESQRPTAARSALDKELDAAIKSVGWAHWTYGPGRGL